VSGKWSSGGGHAQADAELGAQAWPMIAEVLALNHVTDDQNP
jgi:hypothetical protein